MEIFKLQIGDIVESTQGRDLGCRYVVIDIDKKGYCSVINGKLRTMDKPKIKNPIHLAYVGSYPELIERLKLDKEIIRNKNLLLAKKWKK